MGIFEVASKSSLEDTIDRNASTLAFVGSIELALPEYRAAVLIVFQEFETMDLQSWCPIFVCVKIYS